MEDWVSELSELVCAAVEAQAEREGLPEAEAEGRKEKSS